MERVDALETVNKKLLLLQKAGSAVPSRSRAGILLRWKEAGLGLLFLFPSIAIFAIFLFYPMLQSINLSVHSTDPRGRIAHYVGLDNFTDLFLSERFYNSLKVTGLFTLYTVPTGILLALLLAALTYRPLPGIRLFRFVFSMPIALSVGTSAVIWMLLFHPTVGMLNYVLSLVGVDPVFWLSNPNWALISVSLMTVWMNLGFTYIILLSGLQQISSEIHDSAKIDGAGLIRTFWSIMVPLVSPTLFFAVIVSIISALQSFGQIHILTKGGPMNTTDVVVYSIYQEAFVNFRFGSGSAQALVLFVLILLLTWVQFRVFERKVHYQ